MSTNELESENCIGTPDTCAVCSGAADARFGFQDDDLPSVHACFTCAPAGGRDPVAWLHEEVL
jgi:hypothetical protein